MLGGSPADPEVGNAAMAILAELWAVHNEALTAKMAELVPGPARGTHLADFPREQRRWLPRRLLSLRGGC